MIDRSGAEKQYFYDLELVWLVILRGGEIGVRCSMKIHRNDEMEWKSDERWNESQTAG